METYKGIGTKLYGRREVAPDGSYLATKWVVVLYLPVLPLASYRVWELATHKQLLGTSITCQLVRAPLCWRQVLNCYLASLCMGPVMAYALGRGLLTYAWVALHR